VLTVLRRRSSANGVKRAGRTGYGYNRPLASPIVAVLIAGLLAIAGAELRLRALEIVFKPLATLLLLWVVGVPHTTFARLVVVGIGLSAVGDAALLAKGNGAFMVGLGAFLLAHLAYVIAFVGVARLSPHVVGVALIMAVVTTFMLRAIWKGAEGLHGPTVAYGLVISAMVVSASATLGGPLPASAFAAGGAALFYVSDASLAVNKFRRPFPHAAWLTLGVYWVGQIGIAIAAHSAPG
jgi:alkenylglycerophosphocholine/alkenylglycerophosphoethanolamine hydrolase